MGTTTPADAAATTPPPPGRATPLPLRIAGSEVVLLAAEVDLLLDAIELLRTTIEDGSRRSGYADSEDVPHEVITEFGVLAGLLRTAAQKFIDEPLEPTPAQAGLLRQAIADLSGYHRADLPAGLQALRRQLA